MQMVIEDRFAKWFASALHGPLSLQSLISVSLQPVPIVLSQCHLFQGFVMAEFVFHINFCMSQSKTGCVNKSPKFNDYHRRSLRFAHIKFDMA